MGFSNWLRDKGPKIVVGALAGVGLVAATPVIAAAGVLTATGAAVGAGLGAGAGVLWGELDEAGTAVREETAEQKGRNQAKAEYEAQLEAFKKRAAAALKGNAVHWDLFLSLYAVGYATLHHSDRAYGDDLINLKEFIGGISHTSLPDDVLSAMAQIEQARPTLKSALARAEVMIPKHLSLCDDVVDLFAEDSTRGRWKQLRSA